MHTRHKTPPRELDHRTNDGIDVTLLWNPRSGCVSVAVDDTRQGESFEFEVEPGDALAAFHHPYAYVGHSDPGRGLGGSAQATDRTALR